MCKLVICGPNLKTFRVMMCELYHSEICLELYSVVFFR